MTNLGPVEYVRRTNQYFTCPSAEMTFIPSLEISRKTPTPFCASWRINITVKQVGMILPESNKFTKIEVPRQLTNEFIKQHELSVGGRFPVAHT